ncbi:DivIVA domain-containing protein [Planctomonas psychrotolerans]|uniref:DivIVA domain-containing protein n=1 Tax=Planctomonas psychrotolerans TaxID=2528712 RepID=UPI00123998A6|nr:DivIVA domain-containing protein [Planctomonas psychrotolerans]
MALTPEDVVNKRFQPTKFREGYDQDEVDDFLDEVVVELRRLNQENAELRARLDGGTPAPVAADIDPADVPPATAAQFAEVPATDAAITAGEPAVDAGPVAVPVDLDDETASTASLLQLARRLHEEHVQEGLQRRNALIAEGEANAARITADAEAAQEARLVEAEAAQHARLADIEAAQQVRIVELETEQQARLAELEAEQQARLAELEAEQRARLAEAEAAERARIDALDSDRQQLEARVDELRIFEREYRENLKAYIESQLRELDGSDEVPSGRAATDANEGSLSDRQDSAGG